VPLSEDEQRILSQIEEQFHEDDPGLARAVGETTIYRHAFRNIRRGLAGIILGVIAMFVLLSVHPALAFIGFIVLFGSALYIVTNAKKLGRAGMQELGLVAGRGPGSDWAARFRRPENPEEKPEQ
jgi:Protein of unknown function (DUF3040)